MTDPTMLTNPSHLPSDAFIPFIKAVGRGEKLKRDLTFDEAYAAMELIVGQKASEAQVGAFLIAQRVKGEAVDEILGFTQVMRDQFCVAISPHVQNLLDLVVPYDGKVKTAQLAPAISVVLVEAGVPVAIHGMEDVPTKMGITAAQVLAGLGIETGLSPTEAAARIEKVGFGYFDARYFAPCWQALLPVRHHFGLRTVLNTIEKFLNPANAPFQISGFFHANYIQRIRSTQTGKRASWIIQGEEGSIEMAAGRRTPIFGVQAVHDQTVDPLQVGFPARERVKVPPQKALHVELNRAVLAGQAGSAADQVVLTAGVILSLLQVVPDVGAGLRLARQVLSSGRAAARLDRIRGAR